MQMSDLNLKSLVQEATALLTVPVPQQKCFLVMGYVTLAKLHQM